VDVAKSVSRVGGKAQLAAYHAIAGNLKLAYSQFEELETFSRFGSRLDESTRKIVNHGQRIRACLKQTEFAPVSVVDQITVLLALTEGLFDTVPLDRMREAERTLCAASTQLAADLRERFLSDQKLNDADREAVLNVARQALAPFRKEP
jgi:F-type H+-transporting ATPase subunit alpha